MTKSPLKNTIFTCIPCFIRPKSPILTFELQHNNVLKRLLLLISVLLIGNFGTFYLNLNSTSPFLTKLRWLFDFNKELNIPAIYSGITLLFSAFLLLHIYLTKEGKKKLPWLILSGIFLFLSLDEIIGIHERLIRYPRETFDLSGYLYFSWIIPYGIVTALIGIVYIPFLKRLPKKVMILFITAGFIFVLGAVGIEALSAKQYETFGSDNFGYFLYYTLEEFMEMIGISIFIFALLLYISNNSPSKIATIKISRL